MNSTDSFLIYLDLGELASSKERLRSGDVILKHRYENLLCEANALLETDATSVVEKTGLAPSGDPHDFYAIGGYSWPNSSTPDGLPYLYRDSMTNPEALESSKYDKGRYEDMVHRVAILALAYYYSDDEPYAEHATKLLRTWFIDAKTRMNPNFRFAAARPGVWDGHFSGTIEGVILIELLDYVAIVSASDSWSANDQKQLRAWFGALSEWLATSRFGRREVFSLNNHSSYLLAQVAVFSTYSGDQTRARKAVKLCYKLLRQQICRDGSMPREIDRADAWFYSIYGLRAFAVLARVGELYHEDLWAACGGRLARACSSLGTYLIEHESWPFTRGSKPWVHDAVQLYQLAASAYMSDELARVANLLADYGAAELPNGALRGKQATDVPVAEENRWPSLTPTARPNWHKRRSKPLQTLVFRGLGVMAARGAWFGRRL